VKPDRGGFTLFLSLGYGWQADSSLDETAAGLAGLNLGVGGFVTDDLALMFRISGTNVTYEFTGSTASADSTIDSVSGTGTLSAQYWLTDRFNIEGGLGYGAVDNDVREETGFGLLVAAGYAVIIQRRLGLQAGIEYAPVFIHSEPVHNIGFNVGFQLF
jgi:hypothetical protein